MSQVAVLFSMCVMGMKGLDSLLCSLGGGEAGAGLQGAAFLVSQHRETLWSQPVPPSSHLTPVSAGQMKG